MKSTKLNTNNKTKNNEKIIFLKPKRKRIKKKYKKTKFKSKFNIILFTSIIILISCILAIITIGKYKNYRIINLNNRKPKIIAISYSNERFQRQLQLNKKSAIEVGEVDEYYSYGPNDIDPVFKEKNKDILSRSRGNGYWLWKPYIINKTMIEKLKYGDYLIYTDAAILYMNSTRLIINFMKEHKAKIWGNKLTLKERAWTKRDALILMDADTPYYYDTNQYMAGIQVYQKSKYAIKFIQDLLKYSQDVRIITDDNNVMGKENLPGFRENRHDQTVFSLLLKKYGEANSGSPNMTIDQLNHLKPVIMPNILCMYRTIGFKDYEDLINICRNKFIKQHVYEIT